MQLVDPRRPNHSRQLAGSMSGQGTGTALRYAWLDMAAVDRLIGHYAFAYYDNASTRVVERPENIEIFGLDTGIVGARIVDLDLQPVDQTAVDRYHRQLLRDFVVQMRRGPEAVAARLASLVHWRDRHLDDLRRKRDVVQAKSERQAAHFERWVNRLETTETVCGVVTVFTPMGSAFRYARAVKTAVEWIGRADRFGRRVQGVDGFVAAFSGDAEAIQRVGAALSEFAVDYLAGEGLGKMRGLGKRAVGKRMLSAQMTEVVPSTFAGPATARRYSNNEIARTMWRSSQALEVAQVLADLERGVRERVFDALKPAAPSGAQTR